jgi:hypothetical protein
LQKIQAAEDMIVVVSMLHYFGGPWKDIEGSDVGSLRIAGL